MLREAAAQAYNLVGEVIPSDVPGKLAMGVRQPAGVLPPGTINLITNAPEDAADVVDELIAHPATRRINFTGSSKVGRIIAEKAGRHLQARAARARWQGAADRPQGRRSRPRLRRGELRSFLPPGPDLHVDRADRGRSRGGRRRWPRSWPRKRERCRSVIHANPRPRSGRSSTERRSSGSQTS